MKNQLKALGINEEDLIYSHRATKRHNGWEKQDWYRLKGGDDAVLIRHYLDGLVKVEIKNNHFLNLREYGERCREVANRLGINVEILLAIGHENGNLLPNEIRVHDVAASKHELLDTGIERRKKHILELLGGNLYEKFKIEEMGQLNSKRVASYLASIIK